MKNEARNWEAYTQITNKYSDALATILEDNKHSELTTNSVTDQKSITLIKMK